VDRFLLSVQAGATRSAWEPLLEHIAAERPRRILDVGCGTGVHAGAMQTRCPDAVVVGVDRAPELFDRDAAAGAVLTVGDASALPFADESFDVVWMRFLLQHIPRVEKPLVECFRVLRPGGICIVSESDDHLAIHEPPLPPELENLFAVYARVTTADQRLGRRLTQLLRRAGFSIEWSAVHLTTSDGWIVQNHPRVLLTIRALVLEAERLTRAGIPQEDLARLILDYQRCYPRWEWACAGEVQVRARKPDVAAAAERINTTNSTADTRREEGAPDTDRGGCRTAAEDSSPQTAVCAAGMG
jgi:ubiquinone/menaquinone biosynthesis C-methylase UbiE